MPLISEEGRKNRQNRARGLLNSLKESGHPGRIVFFSDEKNFVVDQTFNPQNDRYICFYDDSDEEQEQEQEEAAGDVPAAAVSRPKYVARSKHPASAMYWGAVASTGEISPLSGSLLDLGWMQGAYIKALRDTHIP